MHFQSSENILTKGSIDPTGKLYPVFTQKDAENKYNVLVRKPNI
jgi:hypothetical protein